MKKQTKIEVQGNEIAIIKKEKEDYISLTDIAKYRNCDAPADIVKNWLRSRSTIEFLVSMSLIKDYWDRFSFSDIEILRSIIKKIFCK